MEDDSIAARDFVADVFLYHPRWELEDRYPLALPGKHKFDRGITQLPSISLVSSKLSF